MNDDEIRQLDELETSHWWYRNRKTALASWVKTLPVNSKILDAGSASGGNTMLLQSLGFDVSSLEFSDFGCKLQEGKGINVTQGDLCNMPWGDDAFDAVICMDVLEHIEYDKNAILEISRVLRPNGSFLITVPEDERLWSKHDTAVNHYRRYSKAGLNILLNAGDLEARKIWSSNVAIKPIIKILRKRSTGSDLYQLPTLINWSLLAWANLERHTFLRKFSGVTLWVCGSNRKATSSGIEEFTHD